VTARDIDTFFRVPADRVTVVPNGLDHLRFTPGPQSTARAVVCKAQAITAPFFLYVARLEHPGKNHSQLIAAFNAFKAASCSHWKLVLAGSDWHGAETIHALIDASPFAGDIHRLGFVPSTDLPDWYRAADVFVFPSLYEGFGLPPLEAMACGCPVLSSSRGALGETVGTAAGMLDPQDVTQIQAQLTRAATDDAWREQLRFAGLVRSHAFNWQSTATTTLAVYAQALTRHAGSRSARSRMERGPSPS
jgi:glycosyltransferase involved in cell wall biosynthesis